MRWSMFRHDVFGKQDNHNRPSCCSLANTLYLVIGVSALLARTAKSLFTVAPYSLEQTSVFIASCSCRSAGFNGVPLMTAGKQDYQESAGYPDRLTKWLRTMMAMAITRKVGYAF